MGHREPPGKRRAGAHAVAFTPDGKCSVSGGLDALVRVWDVKTGSLVKTLTGHRDAVFEVVVSARRKRRCRPGSRAPRSSGTSSAGRSSRRSWDTGGAIVTVAFSPDGQRILTGSMDGTARLWDAATGRALHVFAIGRGMPVRAVAISPDGKRALMTLPEPGDLAHGPRLLRARAHDRRRRGRSRAQPSPPTGRGSRSRRRTWRRSTASTRTRSCS